MSCGSQNPVFGLGFAALTTWGIGGMGDWGNGMAPFGQVLNACGEVLAAPPY